MTDDRARKKAVRRRMAQTGEKYTEALRALQEAAREAADRGGAVDRPPSGFQLRRFTEQSRQVVVLAREEAHTLKHDFVGGEHILLGLLRERGFAAWVLESLGVTVERVRVRVVEIVGLGETVRGRIPFTSGAKEALEFALASASQATQVAGSAKRSSEPSPTPADSARPQGAAARGFCFHENEKPAGRPKMPASSRSSTLPEGVATCSNSREAATPRP